MAWFTVPIAAITDRAYDQFKIHQTSDSGGRYRCPCASCRIVREKFRIVADNMNLLPKEGE